MQAAGYEQITYAALPAGKSSMHTVDLAMCRSTLSPMLLQVPNRTHMYCGVHRRLTTAQLETQESDACQLVKAMPLVLLGWTGGVQ
jgi:hypothetical protein